MSLVCLGNQNLVSYLCLKVSQEYYFPQVLGYWGLQPGRDFHASYGHGGLNYIILDILRRCSIFPSAILDGGFNSSTCCARRILFRGDSGEAMMRMSRSVLRFSIDMLSSECRLRFLKKEAIELKLSKLNYS